MKASELKEDMFPQKEVLQTYEKAGQTYEPTVHDRVWTSFFYPLVTADSVKDQEIKKVIPQLYRTKFPSTGKEWLFYNVELSGLDWKNNRKDFHYMEGIVDGIPVFNYEIDPSTNQIIPQTT